MYCLEVCNLEITQIVLGDEFHLILGSFVCDTHRLFIIMYQN